CALPIFLPARHRGAAHVLGARHVRERGVSVAAEQHAVVAADAARFLEDLEPALLLRRERGGVSAEVAVERRTRRDQRALERRDRLRDVVEGERSEEHTSELQSRENLVCRLLL